MGLNFIPGVGQLCDIRDIAACIKKLTVDNRVNEVMIWITVLLTAIGCIPYAGDVIKAGCKAVLKGADDVILVIFRKLDAEDVYKAFKLFKATFIKSIDDAIAMVFKWLEKAGNSKYGKKITKVLAEANDKLHKAADFVKSRIDDLEERLFKKEKDVTQNCIENIGNDILENLDKRGYILENASSVGNIDVELLNEVQKSAKFKNATKYLDDIIIDNGKANPSKLKEIRLALEKGEFSFEEVSEIYNTMCKLNISEAYEKELIEHMDFGKYLSKMVGEKPADMCNPHAHHILFKVGNRAKQKELVKQGQEILRKYGIDPIAGKDNLVWAPNAIKGQHDIEALEMVVDTLKQLDEIDADYEDIVAALNRFGTIASNRK